MLLTAGIYFSFCYKNEYKVSNGDNLYLNFNRY